MGIIHRDYVVALAPAERDEMIRACDRLTVWLQGFEAAGGEGPISPPTAERLANILGRMQEQKLFESVNPDDDI